MENRWIIILTNIMCVMFLNFAVEVKDNETLIYHWDVHHKIYYYCQFGTHEEVTKSDTFEEKCLTRNQGVQYILQSGVKTFPYLAFGSSAGFILKCGDIPNADLHGCNKYVYTWCNYTCKFSSSLVQDIRCQLKGPKENITAEWSIAVPCPENSHGSHPKVAPGTGTGHDNITSDFTNKSNVSLEIGNVTNTASTLVASSTDNSLIAAYSVIGIVVIGATVVILGLLFRQRQYKQKRQKPSTVPEDGECMYENFPVVMPVNTPENGSQRSSVNDAPPPAPPPGPPPAPPPAPPLGPPPVPTGPPNIKDNAVDEIINVPTGPPDFNSVNTVDERIIDPLSMPVASLDIGGSNYTAPAFASNGSRYVDSYPDKKIEKAFMEIFLPDLDDSCDEKLINGQCELEINNALDDFVSMRSGFSTWDKTKLCLEEYNGLIAQG